MAILPCYLVFLSYFINGLEDVSGWKGLLGVHTEICDFGENLLIYEAMFTQHIVNSIKSVGNGQ
eukprot:12895742-Ditylum_brightwellii.AAC.1